MAAINNEDLSTNASSICVDGSYTPSPAVEFEGYTRIQKRFPSGRPGSTTVGQEWNILTAWLRNGTGWLKE